MTKIKIIQDDFTTKILFINYFKMGKFKGLVK